MSRPLNPNEKRTIRIASIGVAIYLVVFYGFDFRDSLQARRAEYDGLVTQAKYLRDVIQPYQDKIATTTNLMDRFRMDPLQLKRPSVVAQASAAIQQAAAAGGVGVGPIRETAGRVSAKEAGSIQFEGTGPIPSVMALLYNLDRVGFPVVIDSIQITSNPMMPNAIKVNLTIVVLDYDAWKSKEEKSHA